MRNTATRTLLTRQSPRWFDVWEQWIGRCLVSISMTFPKRRQKPPLDRDMTLPLRMRRWTHDLDSMNQVILRIGVLQLSLWLRLPWDNYPTPLR